MASMAWRLFEQLASKRCVVHHVIHSSLHCVCTWRIEMCLRWPQPACADCVQSAVRDAWPLVDTDQVSMRIDTSHDHFGLLYIDKNVRNLGQGIRVRVRLKVKIPRGAFRRTRMNPVAVPVPLPPSPPSPSVIKNGDLKNDKNGNRT